MKNGRMGEEKKDLSSCYRLRENLPHEGSAAAHSRPGVSRFTTTVAFKTFDLFLFFVL